jgi:twitching motility protein PilT
MEIDELLALVPKNRASDLHLTAGLPPMLRIDGRLVPTQYEKLTPHECQRLVYSMLTDRQKQKFEETLELDLSYGVAGIGRFRVNVYWQRGSVGAAMRAIPAQVPSAEELNLPPLVRELAYLPRGLILVTGPTGSGKSTTQACMIDIINSERRVHIVTIEDPIEYLHRHKLSMINQRELGLDTLSFQYALRAVLREDPDVILIGEMRDY